MDTDIRDRHFLEFEHYERGQWLRYCAYARSLIYDREEAQMLAFVNAQGQPRFYNPIRHLTVRPCDRRTP